MTMKGLPLTYNRDMQEDKEPLFDAADQLRGSLEMARVVADTVKSRTRAAAGGGARKAGWSPPIWPRRWRAPARPSTRRTRLRASWCSKAFAPGKKPADWTPEALAAFAPEFTPEMAKLLDPVEGMKSRAVKGGTAPVAVQSALAEAAERLARMR